MTGAQMLIEQGKAEGLEKGLAKGLEKGLAKGLEKGRAEGKAELLLRLLRRKYGRVPAGVAKRLRGAASGDLDRWADRVMTAAGLEDVFDSR